MTKSAARYSPGLTLDINSVTPSRTAIAVVDMWDWHPCKTFLARSQKFAILLNTRLNALRETGYHVIFCPHGTTAWMKQQPQYRRVLSIDNPRARAFDPPLPIDLARGTCECEHGRCPAIGSPSKQSPHIDVAPNDVLLDGGGLGRYCLEHRIDRVLYAGQALNMCVLTRPFGLIETYRSGVECAVISDMTISFVGKEMSAEKGHDLVLDHIARHIACVVSSKDLTGD